MRRRFALQTLNDRKMADGLSPEIQLVHDLRQCALLFATPVTEEDYYRVMCDGPLIDYAAATLRGESAIAVWKERYSDLVSAAQDLIQTALKLGAMVYTRAGLREVAEATARCNTVILVAHWRGASVHPEEVRGVYAQLVQVCDRKQTHPIVELIGGHRDPDTLTERLNTVIANGSLLPYLPTAIAAVARKSNTLSQTLSRDLIDELFADVLPPGNRVEFYDGQHTPAAFEEAIDRSFEGEIDLATCRSEVLATFLDLRRQNRIHHIHWPDLVDPFPQYVLIGAALRYMAETSGTYIRSRLTIEQLL